MPKQSLLLLLSAVAYLIIATSSPALAARPNVLVVMVDDLGFSDLGCYGSEIDTPNLDRLAENGLRFSQFYNTAKCHSSRVSLLTGRYCIQAGDTKLNHGITTAEVLSQAGYSTAMTGKWHLDKQPTDFGFDRYFGHLSGACNYFKGDNTFRLNGQPWTVPDKDFYTTVANVDYAIDFLAEARETKKPWYLYVAFNAPHAPLQALEVDYRKYEGRYEQGWDKIREARVAKQKAVGLFNGDVTASPRPEHIPAWDSLSESRRDWESRRMTTLAAMIDRVDQELGRLVEDLRERNELDNTLILFVSDNGACPYDRRSTNIDAEPISGDVTWSDSTGWAWARNSPFRFYKQNQFEGGIGTPAIVHWPAGLATKPGSIVDTPAHLIDVMPTLAEVCEATLPTTWPDREVRPLAGVSLAPILAGKPLNSRPPIHLLFASDRGFRDGDWKIVSFQKQPWELYNLRDDRTELNDLAKTEPERLNAMVDAWTQMAKEVLHAPANAYAPVLETATGHVHREWTNFSTEPKANAPREKKGKQKSSASSSRDPKQDGIRARIHTSLEIAGSSLIVTSSGDDSGIAIDKLSQPIASGPYVLAFRVKATGDGQGEVYYAVDPKVTLPKATRIELDVPSDGQWHEVKVDLKTTETIHALRLDLFNGEGSATIDGLRLENATGETLRSWPN